MNNVYKLEIFYWKLTIISVKLDKCEILLIHLSRFLHISWKITQITSTTLNLDRVRGMFTTEQLQAFRKNEYI